MRINTNKLIKFVNNSSDNFIVINSNNDPGTKIILNCYRKKLNKKKNKLFQSIRFENFLTLLKNAKYILGNSSTGIYEAPIFGVPAINIGSRQYKRSNMKAIKNLEIDDLNSLNIEHFINHYKKTKKKFMATGRRQKNLLK